MSIKKKIIQGATIKKIEKSSNDYLHTITMDLQSSEE